LPGLSLPLSLIETFLPLIRSYFQYEGVRLENIRSKGGPCENSRLAACKSGRGSNERKTINPQRAGPLCLDREECCEGHRWDRTDDKGVKDERRRPD
jgi:hypothetical protein